MVVAAKNDWDSGRPKSLFSDSGLLSHVLASEPLVEVLLASGVQASESHPAASSTYCSSRLLLLSENLFSYFNSDYQDNGSTTYISILGLLSAPSSTLEQPCPLALSPPRVQSKIDGGLFDLILWLRVSPLQAPLSLGLYHFHPWPLRRLLKAQIIRLLSSSWPPA